MPRVYFSRPNFFLTQFFATISVQSKTILNDHGEIIGETAEEDQESQETDELPEVNQDLDEDKRTYKPRVYYPRFSKYTAISSYFNYSIEFLFIFTSMFEYALLKNYLLGKTFLTRIRLVLLQ